MQGARNRWRGILRHAHALPHINARYRRWIQDGAAHDRAAMARSGGRIATGALTPNTRTSAPKGSSRGVPTSLDYKAGTSATVVGSEASRIARVHDSA